MERPGSFQVQVVAGAGDAHAQGVGSLPEHRLGFPRSDEAAAPGGRLTCGNRLPAL